MREQKIKPGAQAVMLAIAVLSLLAVPAFAQVRASITTAPPDLPAYDQPFCINSDICPLDGYLWVPGYWAWDSDYYWVPGTWVMAPEIGDLWTPGYWSSINDGAYVFHEGYWGRSVGFYGGIDYGFGYPGHGYDGARWEDGRLRYNTAANHVNTSHPEWSPDWNYNTPVNDSGNRNSCNGGGRGIDAHATSQEEAADRGKRSGPSLQQIQNDWFARNDVQQRLSTNHGAPPITGAPLPHLAVHPEELPPIWRFAIHTGNPELDQKYQKEQDELVAKQELERKKLAKQQNADRLKINQERAAQTYDPWEMEHVRPDHVIQTQELFHRERRKMRALELRQQPVLADQLKTAN